MFARQSIKTEQEIEKNTTKKKTTKSRRGEYRESEYLKCHMLYAHEREGEYAVMGACSTLPKWSYNNKKHKI